MAKPLAAKKIWPKILRDPVHNTIAFEDTPEDRLLVELINTREFQRLRRIKQLGMCELVFPGAVHTRFAHSIGVMHTARRFLRRVNRIRSEELTDEHQILILTACLLHDVGHGPFSHTFEKITGEDHEDRTLEIILDPATEVHQVLDRFSPTLNLPELLKSFFAETDEPESAPADVPPFLAEIVSSQLDADRFDYLLRDSLNTGVGYGRFDSEWIIDHLYVRDDDKTFYLSHKGLLPAEQYVFARYHMYRIVYFHKTTRSAEVMLRLIFRRYKDLLNGTESIAQKRRIVPDAPRSVINAFSGNIKLAEYLALDDHIITAFLRACETANDGVLQTLAHGLLNRRLFKGIDVTETMSEKPDLIMKIRTDATEYLRRNGVDPEYALALDTAADVAYKPYDPAEERPAAQIYVENTLGKIREISLESKPVSDLKSKYSLIRYYFPADIRSEISRISQGIY